MSEDKQIDRLKGELIGKIYDMALNPEDHELFIADWSNYIEQVISNGHDRRNSDGTVETTLEASDLALHFARANVILEKTSKVQQDNAKRETMHGGDTLFRFNREGGVIENNGNGAFRTIQKIEDLGAFLDNESARAWLEFTGKILRAPTLEQIQIFQLVGGGNLMAFNTRQNEHENIETIVRNLKIAWDDELKTVLKQQFHLTNREISIVESLSAHGSLEALIKKSERSKNTIRTQMKSVFRKLNVHSQPELIQSITVLAHLCSHIKMDVPTIRATPHLGTQLSVTIDNDAPVPVHRIGPDTGRPLLFIHGMLDGVAVTSKIIAALEKYNFQIVAPIRPAFGTAKPRGNIPEAPKQFADQLYQIAQTLELFDLTIIGHMSGAVYAYPAAKTLGKRCNGIVNISGGVPIITMEQFKNMPPRQKAFAYTARFAPMLLPTLMKAGVAQIDAMNTRQLMLNMHPTGSADRQVVENPEIAFVVEDGYRFAVSQGYRGFEADAYHVTRDWSELTNGLNVPVLLLHGLEDPVVTIGSVRDFAERKHFKLVEYPNSGQLIFYQDPFEVFYQIHNFLKSIISKKH